MLGSLETVVRVDPGGALVAQLTEERFWAPALKLHDVEVRCLATESVPDDQNKKANHAAHPTFSA